MLAIPETDGVKVAWQLAVPVGPGTSEQGEPVKLPAEPVELNVTLPVGVIADEAPDASVTVAVHVEGCPTATVPGTHETLVDEARAVTVIPVLPVLVTG